MFRALGYLTAGLLDGHGGRPAGGIRIPRSDIRRGWVVQRWKDGVRVLQIHGRRSGQMFASGQRGGRHEFQQASQLGGVVLARQSTALSEDDLLLCDNEAVLRVIKKWVGQGGKAKLAAAPDADILREIVCLLTQRVRAGRATFLIKVKSHRGEPINERADTLAEEGREISDDDKRWDDRTDRMTFEVKGT